MKLPCHFCLSTNIFIDATVRLPRPRRIGPAGFPATTGRAPSTMPPPRTRSSVPRRTFAFHAANVFALALLQLCAIPGASASQWTYQPAICGSQSCASAAPTLAPWQKDVRALQALWRDKSKNELSLGNDYTMFNKPNNIVYSTQNTIHLKSSNPGLLGNQMDVFDPSGKLIKTSGIEQTPLNSIAMNMKPGIYFCRYTYDGILQTQKVIFTR